MHLDRRTVSRKTPRDGKLEISADASSHLAPLGPHLSAGWHGAEAPAALVRMSCTCGSGNATHEHHFLESVLFRTLPVGETVDVTLESGVVRVVLTPSP